MLGDLYKKMPSALARGLTETAKDTRQHVQRQMPIYIDRPTPWTRRSVFFFPAEKNEKPMRAMVALKDEDGFVPRRLMDDVKAAQPMRMQVYGGKRKLKASEKTLQRAGLTSKNRPYLTPGPGARLDRYGNVTGSFMNKVLYQGVARGSASYGYAKPMSNTAMARARKKYFIKVVRGEPQGIFERMRKKREIRPVFFFTDQPTYRPRFPFHRIAQSHANKIVKQKINESVDFILKKYRR